MNHIIEFEENGHIYRVEGKKKLSVNGIIDGAGLRPPYRGSPKYGQRGTAVHSICQYYDEDRLGEVKSEYQGYLDSYIQFLEMYHPFYYQIEVIQYNENLDFIGTPDRGGFFSKQAFILDIKSGVPTKTDGIALYGYQLLQDKPEKYKLFDLYLKKDGSIPKLEEQNKPSDRNAFMAALSICHWKGEMK